MNSTIAIGAIVRFTDELRHERPALVGCVFDQADGPPLLNLVVVSDDPTREDSYGRQIEHRTSVAHASRQNPPVGLYWREA